MVFVIPFERALVNLLCNSHDIDVNWILGKSGMAESCNIWLISDIHDVMYVAGAGRVLGLSRLNLHGPSSTPRYTVFVVLLNCVFLCH